MGEQLRQKPFPVGPARRRDVPADGGHAGRMGVARWLILAVVLLMATIVALPWLIALDRVERMVLRGAQSLVGYQIKAESVGLSYLPTVEVVLNRVRVIDPGTEMLVASADRAEFGLRLLSLFADKPVVDSARITGLKATVEHDDADGWRLAGTRSQQRKRDAGSEQVDVDAWPERLFLQEGRITIRLPSAETAGPEAVLTDLFVSMERDLSQEILRVVLAARLALDATAPMPFSFVGRVLDTAGHDRELRTRTVADGLFEIQGVDPRRLAALAGYAVPADGRWPFTVTAQLQVSSSEQGMGLQLPHWTLRGPDLSLQGRTTLEMSGGSRHYWLTLSAAEPLSVQALLEHLPLSLFPSRIGTALSDADPAGQVNIESLTVAGDVGEAPPTIVGRLTLSKGRAVVNGERLDDLNAAVRLDPGQARIDHLEGTYAGIGVTSGSARLQYLDERLPLEFALSGHVPAEQLLTAIERGALPVPSRSTIALVRRPAGDLHFTLEAGGGLADGELRMTHLLVASDDLRFESPSIPWPIDHVSGQVSFKGEDLHIERLMGQVGPLAVTARGHVDVSGGTLQTFKVDAVADADRLREAFAGKNGEDGLFINGRLRASATLRGAVRSPEFETHLDLAGTGLVVQGLLEKRVGRPASMTVSGVVEEDVLRIDRLALTLPPAEVTVQGLVDLKSPWPFEANVQTRAVDVAAMNGDLSFGPLTAGTVKVTGRVTGSAADWKTSKAWGRLDLRDGRLVSDALTDPLEHVVIGLQADGERLDIEEAAATVGQSTVRISGTIDHWLDAPDGRLLIEAPSVNVRKVLDLRRNSQSGDQEPGLVQEWLGSAHIVTTAFARYLYYDRLLLTGLSSRMLWDHGVLTLHRMSADTDAGLVSIRGTLDPPDPDKPGRFEVGGRVTGITLTQLLGLFGYEDEVMTGAASFKGRLAGELDESGVRAATLTSDTRTITVILEQGELHQFPVVSRLLSILNLPAILQGDAKVARGVLPYDRVLGRFTVDEGVMTIQELFVDSPVLKISASGTYDVAHDRFDVAVATSPLGSYADLLKEIPLFGKLFAGERQGLDTALFTVEGPLRDPTITYRPVASLARGLTGVPKLALDVLVNALTLPRDVASMLQGED